MIERFEITFEPMRDARFRATAMQRVRGLIKSAGRAWGLRVVNIRELCAACPETSETGADHVETAGGDCDAP